MTIGMRIRFSLSAASLLLLASCKPEPTPIPVDTTMESQITPIILPIVDNVNGVLYSIKVDENDKGKVTISEVASAEFYDEPSNTALPPSKTYAGQVIINEIPLNHSEDNEYSREGVDGRIITNLKFNEGVLWTIQGDDGIPSMTLGLSNRFSQYSGSFPTVITRSKGLSFTFDENTVKYSDSVYVAISAGDKLIVKRYSAKAGTVTIPSEELSALQACTVGKPGYLQISPSSIDKFESSQGSGYFVVMIKQQVVIRSIVIQ